MLNYIKITYISRFVSNKQADNNSKRTAAADVNWMEQAEVRALWCSLEDASCRLMIIIITNKEKVLGNMNVLL